VSDLYQVLGVKRAATKEQIRRAYRRRAKISHPDSGGSAHEFGAVATAYGVLSDTKRREQYDRTGEIEPTQPDNFDASAIEIIAQKFLMIIYGKHDVASMDIAGLVEEAIHEDIAQRNINISSQRRAVQRATELRARVKRKADDQENMLARVLDWHELSTRNLIKKNEEAVCSMNRALEILNDYSFAEDLPSATPEQLSEALHDILVHLAQLTVLLKPQPGVISR
jgi:curved DNA-binding protein CbpA